MAVNPRIFFKNLIVDLQGVSLCYSTVIIFSLHSYGLKKTKEIKIKKLCLFCINLDDKLHSVILNFFLYKNKVNASAMDHWS